GHAVFFEFLASGEVLFPGIRQLVDANLLEDILAVRIGTATEEVRHTAGDPVNLDRSENERINLVTTEFGNELIVIFQTTGVEVRGIIEELQNVGALAAFDSRRGPGRQVIGIDVLNGDLHPGLLAKFRRLLVSDDIGCWDKATPFQDVQSPGLRESRRLPANKL